MPVLSAHCFANHKGGVGKTTLCYQIAAQYAAAHPDKKVLVADFTASGDVSEFLLGGVHEDRGRKALNAVVPLSNTTHFCLRALAAASAHLDALVQGPLKLEDEESGSAPETSVYGRVLAHMPRSKRAKLSAESREQEIQFEGEGALDLSEFAVPVCQVNGRVPSNLYLCPSGVEFEPPIQFSQSQQHRIVSVLRNCFKYADGDWKVFIDTDAAHNGGSDVYTEIGLSISDFCLLPLHADVSEWLRAKATFGVLRDLREKGISGCTVQMVLWNKLSVRNSRESLCSETQRCSFTPTKAEQDMVRTLYGLLYELATQYPADFFNFNAENPRRESFKPAACMRHLTVVGLASKDVGVPIAAIHAGIFHGVHMTYNLSQYSVERCRDNLRLIVEAIDEGDEISKSRERPLRLAFQSGVARDQLVGSRSDQRPAKAQEQEHVELQDEEPSGVQQPSGVEELSENKLESTGPEVPSPQHADETAGSESEERVEITGLENRQRSGEISSSGQSLEDPSADTLYLQQPEEELHELSHVVEEIADTRCSDGPKEHKSGQPRAKRRGRRARGSAAPDSRGPVFKTYSLRNQYSLRSKSCAARFSLHFDGRPWLQ